MLHCSPNSKQAGTAGVSCGSSPVRADDVRQSGHSVSKVLPCAGRAGLSVGYQGVKISRISTTEPGFGTQSCLLRSQLPCSGEAEQLGAPSSGFVLAAPFLGFPQVQMVFLGLF